jgi:hypothetical protein
VKPDPHAWREPMPETVLGQYPLDLDRAAERVIGIHERFEEAVPRVIDFIAAVAREETTQCLVVPPRR